MIERRFAELRAADVVFGVLSGHASVFDQETRIRDYHEVIAPTAFDRALREQQDVVLLANHDGLPLAATYAGNLHLLKDSTGLAVRAELPDTTMGRDVEALTRAGILRSMSFGFQVRDEEWTPRDGGGDLRTIKDVDLFDVSVVTFPAYAGTDLALRAMNAPDRPPTNVPRVTARGQAALIRARLKVK